MTRQLVFTILMWLLAANVVLSLVALVRTFF